MIKSFTKHFYKEDTQIRIKNRFSALFIIRGMQITTTMKYSVLFVRIIIVQGKEKWKIISPGKHRKKLECLYIVGKNVKQHNFCEKPFCIYSKFKHRMIIWHCNFTFRIYPKELKTSSSKSCTYTHVHSNIIHSR